MNVSTQRRNEILDALRRGTVPRAGLDTLAVGLDRFRGAVGEELDRVSAGGACFKAIRGDREMGVRSLPVQLGAQRAAWVACWFMAGAQVLVIALLAAWGAVSSAAIVAMLLVAQFVLMRRFLRDPIGQALFYSGFGVPLFVAGMMVSAFALRGLAA